MTFTFAIKGKYLVKLKDGTEVIETITRDGEEREYPEPMPPDGTLRIDFRPITATLIDDEKK